MQFIILIIVLILIIITNIKIVPQSKTFVIERLGSYKSTWQTGLHFKIPFIESNANKIVYASSIILSIIAIIVPFTFLGHIIGLVSIPFSYLSIIIIITKDNVTMQIDTVVYYQITDPKLYTYGVENPINAIETLTATTLRNIIGELELDETLTSRDLINNKMCLILDEATDPWGIKINRVEVKNIIPPRDIQEAMEKQMRAERERREKILQAEGEKKSSILIAEGEKESAILRAEAQKESQIKLAEGEAEAILKVQEATAAGIKLLKEAGADKSVLALKQFETLEKVAEGQATKIIIPSDMQNMASLVTTASELLKK